MNSFVFALDRSVSHDANRFQDGYLPGHFLIEKLFNYDLPGFYFVDHEFLNLYPTKPLYGNIKAPANREMIATNDGVGRVSTMKI